MNFTIYFIRAISFNKIAAQNFIIIIKPMQRLFVFLYLKIKRGERDLVIVVMLPVALYIYPCDLCFSFIVFIRNSYALSVGVLFSLCLHIFGGNVITFIVSYVVAYLHSHTVHKQQFPTVKASHLIHMIIILEFMNTEYQKRAQKPFIHLVHESYFSIFLFFVLHLDILSHV